MLTIDPLHPAGRCTCEGCGDGDCDWCVMNRRREARASRARAANLLVVRHLYRCWFGENYRMDRRGRLLILLRKETDGRPKVRMVPHR